MTNDSMGPTSPAVAVSVVIATYRATDHLRVAIESARAQTFADLEIVVSDDSADPRVEALANSFGDPRIRYRANGRVLGPAGNHWAAFGDCRGEFITILNHDDRLEPECVAELVGAIRSERGVRVSFCDQYLIDDDGNVLADATERAASDWGRSALAAGRHEPFVSLVIDGAIPIANGAMFRRADVPAMGELDPSGAYDLYLSSHLAARGGAAVYVARRLVAWRVHPGQLTRAGDSRWASGALDCWRWIAAEPAFRSVRREAQCKRSEAAFRISRIRAAEGHFLAARSAALEAIGARALDWRPWAMLGGAELIVAIGLLRRWLAGRGAVPTPPAPSRMRNPT